MDTPQIFSATHYPNSEHPRSRGLAQVCVCHFLLYPPARSQRELSRFMPSRPTTSSKSHTTLRCPSSTRGKKTHHRSFPHHFEEPQRFILAPPEEETKKTTEALAPLQIATSPNISPVPDEKQKTPPNFLPTQRAYADVTLIFSSLPCPPALAYPC